MPPKKDKKKAQEEEKPGYNVGIMTLDQLKQYARLLEGQIEELRRHCNFYQKMEDELVDLLRITEEDLRYNKDTLLSKDVELERLKLTFINHIHEKNQWPKYMERDSTVIKKKLSSETCNRLEQEENRHFQETKRLKSVLQEKDRQLESLRVKIEMARRDTKEKNENYLEQMEDQQMNLLEEAVNRFDFVMKETQDDFKQVKETMKYEAREDKIKCERYFTDACKIFKQKLHDYYKEVTKQDLETIKKLKRQIKKVNENIGSSNVLLKEALHENKQLKEFTQSKIARHGPSNIVTKFDAGPLEMIEALRVHNKTEKLTLENQNLEKQIRNVMEQIYNLRRQFTLALRKVRDNAEMKAVFLERKLNFILDDKKNGPESILTESTNESSEQSATETDSSQTYTSENS